MVKSPALLYKTMIVGIIILFIVTNSQIGVGVQLNKNSDLSLITIKVNGENVNDWYVSDVGFNFTYESEDIAEIQYMIDGGGWETYYEPFYLTDDGEDILLEWCAVDHEGNYSEIDGPFICSIDQTGPEIRLTYEVLGGNPIQGWEFEFTATAYDRMSGMDRVEFYLNNELQETVYGPGPDYVWTLRYWPLPRAEWKAIAYDKVGHFDYDEISEPCKITNFESSEKNVEICKEKRTVYYSINNTSSYNNEKENHNIPLKNVSSNHIKETFDPGFVIVVLNRKMGKNNWTVSNATIPIFYESDRIDKIYYQINGESWFPYNEQLVISNDGNYVFSWYVVDYEGHASTPESISFKIDQTCPEISLVRKKITIGKIKFTANVYDDTSGVNRVRFESDYSGSFTDYDFPFEWIWTPENFLSFLIDIVTAIVYDNGGNSNSYSMYTRSSSYIFNHESRQRSLL